MLQFLENLARLEKILKDQYDIPERLKERGANTMDHEAAVIRIAQREAAGEESMDRELLSMLSYPLPRPLKPAIAAVAK